MVTYYDGTRIKLPFFVTEKIDTAWLARQGRLGKQAKTWFLRFFLKLSKKFFFGFTEIDKTDPSNYFHYY